MPSTAAERIAADKRAQEKEASERDNSRRGESDAVALDRETELAAAEGAEEALAEDAEQGRRAPSRDGGEHENQRKEPPSRLTPGDDKRKNIFGRFRSDRNAEAENSNNADHELLAFAHQGLPPELADQEKQAAAEAEAGAQEQESQPAVPPKIKVKVRGEERELTIEELTAAAQKGLAGDEYLTEARSTLDAAKSLRAQIEAERAGQPAKHPGERTGAAEEQPTREETAEHPGESSESVVEALQLEAPDVAAKKLDEYFDRKMKGVEETVATKSRETLEAERIRDETTRSQNAQKEFAERNAELAENKYFRAALEVELYDQQMSDLQKLGVTSEKMQAQIGRAPTNADIAVWHRWYRANGYKVRSVDAMLDDSTSVVLEANPSFKPKSAASDTPATTRTEPAREAKVTVNVDRTARRAVLRPQPTRSATPRPAAPAAPKDTDRSSVVAQRVQRLQQIRGGNPYQGR